jgi:predicted component of type VI protein secretion system
VNTLQLTSLRSELQKEELIILQQRQVRMLLEILSHFAHAPLVVKAHTQLAFVSIQNHYVTSSRNRSHPRLGRYASPDCKK